MRIALVADTFPPVRTSGAVQLRDLSRELVRSGHEVTVLLPAANLKTPWRLSEHDGVQVLRLRAPRTKDIGYFRRTVGEFLMPFFMLRNFRKSPLAAKRWDGVVWYSPSIFHGPLVNALKKRSGCKGYLILRDIFPNWALDMGLMGRGLPYLFFDLVARYQYSVADIIGVQSPGNLAYFDDWRSRPNRLLEVLKNWLDEPVNLRSKICLSATPLAGRKIIVYAGNMGVAQGMDILVDLAERLDHRRDVGFAFVGRGADVQRLKGLSESKGLSNTIFFDEIHPDAIPDLFRQCSVGLVALDPRHKSHNIPGKLLAYMQCGLPVLANVNRGNDLVALIQSERIGRVCENNSPEELHQLANALLDEVDADPDLSERCRRVFHREFSVDRAARQIVQALSS